MFFFLIKDKISKSKSTSLTFVIKGVPGRFSLSGGGGVFRGIPGCPEGVPGVFRACSGFYRHPTFHAITSSISLVSSS